MVYYKCDEIFQKWKAKGNILLNINFEPADEIVNCKYFKFKEVDYEDLEYIFKFFHYRIDTPGKFPVFFGLNKWLRLYDTNEFSGCFCDMQLEIDASISILENCRKAEQ